MSVQVLHAFLGYSPTGTKDDKANELVDQSIFWILRLDAGVGTVVKRLA